LNNANHSLNKLYIALETATYIWSIWEL